METLFVDVVAELCGNWVGADLQLINRDLPVF